MTPERWKRLTELFEAALARGPSERAEFISRETAGDAMLAEEVLKLLASDEGASEFFNRPPGLDSTGSPSAEPQSPAFAEPFAAAPDDTLKGANDRLKGSQLPPMEPGRYTFGGEHARGGLGRILRAWDGRLNRTVAVKELLTGESDAELRFVREALITARLQHPSIVPIYDLARNPNRAPFYSMKMVSGRSLAELIRETKTLGDRLALLPNVSAVADAVAYAHEQRIIHRDLKPANVLVGSFGETVVIDWGLAADLGQTAESTPESPSDAMLESPRLTQVGAVMGTPEYMPPEQAAGSQVDERADVYALGAMLYHLLAGKPPYQGNSSKEVLAKITQQDPPPLESLQPGVPRDLAQVVAKAMARDAKLRYPTAKELAEDLRRFQTGQLVSAHAYSGWELVRRWGSKHRVVVGAAALVVLSLVAGLLTTSRQAHIARLERTRAERSFADVRHLANSFLFEFHDAIANLAGSTPARVLIVKRAEEYLERLASEPGAEKDLSLQEELAESYDKLGVLQGLPGTANLGDTAGALESFQRALAIRTMLSKARPGDLKAQAGLARSETRISHILQKQGDHSAARRHGGEAVRIAEALVASHPTEMTARIELVRALDASANLFTGSDFGAYVQIRRRILKLEEELSEAAPDDAFQRRDLALACKRLGGALERSGDIPSAIEQYQRALAIDAKLAKDDVNNARARRDLSYSYASLGFALYKSGDSQQALKNYSQALELREALAKADPSNVDLQASIANAVRRIGQIQRALKDWPAAERSYRRAEAIWQTIGESNSVSDQLELSDLHHWMGKLYCEWASAEKLSGSEFRARIDKGRASFQRGLDILLDLRRRGSESKDRTDETTKAMQECEATLTRAE